MPFWLGIDIGRAAVKVALVRSAYRKKTLDAVSSVDLEPGADLQVAIRQAVVGVLGGRVVGTSDGVAVAIDGTNAVVRTLTVPAGVQRQLAEVLPFELEAQLPIEMSESVFDFRPLGVKAADSGDGPGTLEVMVVVARTEDVRARIELVKGALGVEPERVSAGALCLASLIPFIPQMAEEGPVVLVDFGNVASEFVVLAGGQPLFARTLSFGTQGLPQTADRLAREIRVSVGAFRASGGAAPVRVLLCGGGAFVSGAASFLGASLELPVEELPLPQIELGNLTPENIRELPRYAKAMALAVGLGGRAQTLDLRRGPLAYERGFAWVRERVPLLAGLGAVIVVSFFFSAWAQLHGASVERAALESALGSVTKDVLGEETTSFARANELLGQLTAVNDEDPMPHADAFDVMVKLSEDIPQSMTHDIDELDVQKGHVVVHGIVGSIPDAQSIATSLGSEKCFGDVKITRTNQVVGGERQKYVLEFDLKCPEDVKGAKKKEPQAAPGASTTSGGGK